MTLADVQRLSDAVIDDRSIPGPAAFVILKVETRAASSKMDAEDQTRMEILNDEREKR